MQTMLRIVVPFRQRSDGDRSDPEQMQFQQALWELYVAERNFHEATGEMVDTANYRYSAALERVQALRREALRLSNY
ncbi:MAG TPA: hypothetical protein GXZ96_06340 [Firmicutes bacterium]|nr:hypothetical protein [Bacillota bacterium]